LQGKEILNQVQNDSYGELTVCPPRKLDDMKKTKTSCKKAAFTLAETLIAIGIIGVVSALTIPTLVKNYKRKVLETQFKETYAMLSQAFRRASDDMDVLTIGDSWADKKAVAEALMPYLKVTRTFDGTKHDGPLCADSSKDLYAFYPKGYSYSWLGSATRISTPISHSYSVELANGVCVAFGGYTYYVSVDINGSKVGPNTAGYDLFFFIFNDEGKFVPLTYNHPSKSYADSVMDKNCNPAYKINVSGGGGHYCAAKVIKNNFKITYW
jgi:type II secretory pathway pseudopilin PulG